MDSVFLVPAPCPSQMANQKQYHHSLQHPTMWPERLSPPRSQPSLAQRLTGTPGFLPLDQRPKTLGPCQGRRTAEILSFLWSGSNGPSERLFSFPGTLGDRMANPLCQDKKGAIKETREGKVGEGESWQCWGVNCCPPSSAQPAPSVTIHVCVWDPRTPSQHGSRLSTSSTSRGTSPLPTTWSNRS